MDSASAVLICMVVALLIPCGFHARKSMLFKQANKCIRERDYTRALKLAEELIARYPKEYRSFLVAASAAYRLHEYEKTLAYCEDAKRLQAVSQHLYYHSALAKYELCMQDAMQDADRALELFPNYNSILFHSSIYMAYFKFEEALDDCNKAIAMDSTKHSAYAYRSTILLRLNRFEEAEADSEKALELIPKDATSELVAQVLRLRATLLFCSQQKIPEAIEAVSQSMELGDKNVALVARAYFHSVAGDLDAAWKDLDEGERENNSKFVRGLDHSYSSSVATMRNQKRLEYLHAKSIATFLTFRWL
jgi:tetratricopeptide (TPR) repeat protein